MLSVFLLFRAWYRKNPIDISINDKQIWKGTLINRSLYKSEYLLGQAPLSLTSLLKEIHTWQKRQLVCWMTIRNVTTGSKLMTLFFILLAGCIIMNIKVISSLSLKTRTCLSLPKFSCWLYCSIYVLFLLILAGLKHYNQLAVWVEICPLMGMRKNDNAGI